MKPWIVKLCLLPIAVLVWLLIHKYSSPFVGYPMRVRCDAGRETPLITESMEWD